MPPRTRTRKSAPPKKPAPPSVPLAELSKIQDEGKAKHLKATNATQKYMRNINAGRKWLQSHFESPPTEESSEPLEPEPELSGFSQETSSSARDDESFTHPDFKESFDAKPNRFSDRALGLYITYKCMHEGKKIGTGSSICAAFKHMWEQSSGTKYRGKWMFNPLSGEWEGNPVESAIVADVMTAVKHKSSAEGGDRTHSIAMSARYMDLIFQWSKAECDTSLPAGTMEDRQKKTVHLMYRAFSMLAWRTWARCFELVKLKKKDVLMNQENERAFNAKYHRVHLSDRKGWQRKLNKTERKPDLRSNVYKIYDRDDLGGCNSYQSLREWVEFLENDIYHRPLEPDDYIFPAMGSNGIIQPREPVSHDTIQKYIHDFTVGAGVAENKVGTFSTHCFRRGGAQYWHLFAPDNQRWNLRKVWWWGGWAEGENRDTLIRYLLDELHSYKENFSDAMCPFPQDSEGNFVSATAALAPVTVMGMQSLSATMCAKMEDLSVKFSRELQQTVSTFRQPAMDQTCAAVPPLTVSPGVATALPMEARTASGRTLWVVPVPQNQPAAPSYEYPASYYGTSASYYGTSTHSLPDAAVPLPSQIPSQPQIFPSSSANITGPATAHSTGKMARSRPLPTHNLIIPDIPVHLTATTQAKRSDSWRWIVQHWRDGDPDRGLSIPLKDWDQKWLHGANKELLAAKYGQRGVIALEFLEQYQENEASFLAAYPEAENGHSALYDAIQDAREARGDLKRRTRRKGV